MHRSVDMKPIRRRLLAAVVATGALALAGPVSGAGAQVPPAGLPAVASVIGPAGCVGTNRPAIGGNNGSTSATTCGSTLAFNGPQIGQISNIVGPTIIGSPLAVVTVSAGPITPIIG
jgi:hypothetical protein